MLSVIQSMDESLMLLIQELRIPALNGFVEFYTELGHAGKLWIAIALVMLCFRKTRRAGVLALIAMGIGYLINDMVIKNLVCRPRPVWTIEGLTAVGFIPTSWSFPSGHSCCAMAAANVWWRTLEKRWMKVVLLVMAVLMCLSRPYVGAHYVSDILVGALVGSLVGQGVWKLAAVLMGGRFVNRPYGQN